MIRRPPRSTQSRSSAASDVYKRQEYFYSHQPTISPASVREALQTIAGVQDLDLQYPRVIESVKADVGLGRLLSVRQTPTFFINGVKLEGATAQALSLIHISEPTRLGMISYAVFCLKTKKK